MTKPTQLDLLNGPIDITEGILFAINADPDASNPFLVQKLNGKMKWVETATMLTTIGNTHEGVCHCDCCKVSEVLIPTVLKLSEHDRAVVLLNLVMNLEGGELAQATALLVETAVDTTEVDSLACFMSCLLANVCVDKEHAARVLKRLVDTLIQATTSDTVRDILTQLPFDPNNN